MTQKQPSDTFSRYLFYRKNKLIENEIVNGKYVKLHLKDGRIVVLEVTEIEKRKIVLS